MLMTMRKVRLWTLGLCVLTIGAAAAVGARAAGRVLTTQDVVSIKVVNQPDMDTTTRVETDGTIDFPYVGRIKAAGLSEDSLARTIERRLAARQIVTDPHVLVEISNFGTQASVQGQVGAPGVYTLDRPTNLTQILSRAGGVRDVGVGGTITVRRAHGAIVKTFDSKEVQAGRGPGATLLIANNDEIFVDLAPFYYIYGYVGKPGEFPLNSTADSARSYFDRRRIGPARYRMADQDQAQGGGWPDNRCPGFARRPSGGGRHHCGQRADILIIDFTKFLVRTDRVTI